MSIQMRWRRERFVGALPIGLSDSGFTGIRSFQREYPNCVAGYEDEAATGAHTTATGGGQDAALSAAQSWRGEDFTTV